jgi:hypothetical protein
VASGVCGGDLERALGHVEVAFFGLVMAIPILALSFDGSIFSSSL